MDDYGAKHGCQRWSWELLWSWDYLKKDWAFFRTGGGDATEARRWGISLGNAAAIPLGMIATGWLGARNARVFAMLVDPTFLVALAGVMLALGALAGKGKPWAALALMLAFPAFELAILIPGGIHAWSAHRGDGAVLWVSRVLGISVITAIWVRGAYLAWRALRRGTGERPTVAARQG